MVLWDRNIYVDDVLTFITPLMKRATAALELVPPALGALIWEYLLPSARQRRLYGELLSYIYEHSIPDLVDL